jgi:PTS system nitrogen regulatory IIA component
MQLTVSDVARLLNVAEKTVYRWLDDGELPASKVNENYRVNPVELLEWAAAQGRELSPAFLRHFEPRQAPEISAALEAGGVYYGVPGSDKRAVLEALARLPLPTGPDRALIAQIILAREEAGTTAIGGGIAIPHVRMPLVVRTQQPAVALCFLEKPVDFQAPDGKPVDTLFVLLSTSVRIHLYLLSKLAYLLHDAAFRAVLAKKAPAAELLAAVRTAEAPLRAEAAREQP